MKRLHPEIAQLLRVLPNGSSVSTALALALSMENEQLVWVARNLYPFSFLYKYIDSSTASLENDYKMILQSFLYRFPDGKWRISKSGREIPMFTDQINSLLEEAYFHSDDLTTNDIIWLGFNNTMPQDIADYINYTYSPLAEIAAIRSEYGQVKAKGDGKEKIKEFKGKFLYPRLLSYIKEKNDDEDFIKKFEEAHKLNNIDTKIKHLKDFIKQIDEETSL